MKWTAAGIALLFWLTACDSTPTPTRSFEVANRGALSASLSDTGSYAIIGSAFEGGSLWRVADVERLYNWNHRAGEQSTIQSSAFSPDQRWAVTATTHTIVFWDLASGQATRFWNAPAEILDMALTPDGNYALLGLVDGSAVMFDIKRGGISRTFRHTNRVRKVALTADAKFALTGSEDYTAILWDVTSGAAVHTFKHAEEVQMVALSADGRRALTAAKYDKAVLWDLETGRAIGNIPLQATKIKRGLRFTAARFSADGQALLTGRPDEIVQLWDVEQLQERRRWRLPKRETLQPTGAAVLAVAFAETGYVAVASNGFVHTLR
jgi:WD40 repeat protein